MGAPDPFAPERRPRTDRFGSDRRAVEMRRLQERREQAVPVDVDRRVAGDRRMGLERRSGIDRRDLTLRA